MELKEIFNGINDELAEKIGKEIAKELNLKKVMEKGWDAPRYQLDGGTFTNKGLARRIARIFIETEN